MRTRRVDGKTISSVSSWKKIIIEAILAMILSVSLYMYGLHFFA